MLHAELFYIYCCLQDLEAARDISDVSDILFGVLDAPLSNILNLDLNLFLLFEWCAHYGQFISIFQLLKAIFILESTKNIL